MTNNTAATGFVGWHRPDKRSSWRPVLTAETEDATFEQLLDAVPGGDKCVLAAGVDPNTDHPAPRRRRL